MKTNEQLSRELGEIFAEMMRAGLEVSIYCQIMQTRTVPASLLNALEAAGGRCLVYLSQARQSETADEIKRAQN